MKHGKQPERRTFLQDRLEILIKKQKNGNATFNELTELDNIVNSNPAIRNRIIREDMLIQDLDTFDDTSGQYTIEHHIEVKQVVKQSFITRIKSFFARMFSANATTIKLNIPIVQTTFKGYKFLLV